MLKNKNQISKESQRRLLDAQRVKIKISINPENPQRKLNMAKPQTGSTGHIYFLMK